MGAPTPLRRDRAAEGEAAAAEQAEAEARLMVEQYRRLYASCPRPVLERLARHARARLAAIDAEIAGRP